MKTPLEKIIDIADGQIGLHRLTGIKQSTISAWLNRFNHQVGTIYVIKVCEAVNFEITPHELRPDIYPHPQDGLPPHLRSEFSENAEASQ